MRRKVLAQGGNNAAVIRKAICHLCCKFMQCNSLKIYRGFCLRHGMPAPASPCRYDGADG